LDWERLHGQDSDSFYTSNDNDMVGPYFDIGPTSVAYTVAHGKAVYEFDEVNLSLGKNLCFCDNLFVNLYAGVAFSRIKQTVKSSYSNNDGTVARYVETPSTFNGADPQVGFNLNYQLCRNFF